MVHRFNLHVFDNLISADRKGDWEGHLLAVQNQFPVF